VGVPFFAGFDRDATWIDDLEPASFERSDVPLPWREVLKWRDIEARKPTEVRPLARAGNCR
jgi:hypothetical protein